MRTECLPPGAVPHLSKLYVDYLAKSPAALRFYSTCTPGNRRGSFPQERGSEISKILAGQNQAWGASAKTLANIEKLRAGASAIVTGQQVALFGGPMFAILKALTAIKRANAASDAGIDCVPIFWLASEDHDLAEVSQVTLQDQNGRLTDLALSSSAKESCPVGDIALGTSIEVAVKQATATFSDPEIAKIVSECYKPTETFANSFAKLFSRLFADYGLILLDPGEAGFHRFAQPILRAVAEKSDELNAALLVRGKELEVAGYHAQVKVTSTSTLLFALQDGVRTAIHRSNGNFSIGKEKLRPAELLKAIDAQPERFSGNALLRPVIQDHLLPTLAYIGGPAEVAYFAQSEVLYQRLLGQTTPILPRISATLVDAKAQRLLNKYGLTVPQTFLSSDELLRKIADASLPEALTSNFDSARSVLEKQTGGLTAQLKSLDPTLVEAANRAASKMKYQLSRLQQRAAAAQTRRNQEIKQHAAFLSDSLYPHKDLQERSIAGISFLGRHGLGLLQRLHERSDLVCLGHQLIPL